MKHMGTLIAVKDLEKAKQFYFDVLGMEVVDDFGANVSLTGDVFLQTAETWKSFIHVRDDEIIYKNNAVELYFEEDDIELFVKKLETFKDVIFIHPLIEHRWGQKAIRFYDPDGHIIEVAENMDAVVWRFIENGLSDEETAARMGVSIDYVKSSLSRAQ